MQKTKNSQIVLVTIIMFALVAMYGFIPLAKAEALDNAKDTLSDSDVSVAADHVIEFTTSEDVGANGYFEVTLPADFGDVKTATCSSASVGVEISTTTETLRCTFLASPGAATTSYMYITNVTNPSSEGDQTINVGTYNSGDEEKEFSAVKVYIIEDVSVTARVPGTLSFGVAGIVDGITINETVTTATSTATTTPFGTLSTAASSTVGQTLTVSTNASAGFSVTVQQSDELKNGAGASINSFANALDDSGSTTPVSWVNPSADYGLDWTYGHMAITSDDGGLAFAGGKYAGLNDTAALEVFSHNGATNGTGTGIGTTNVAYSIQISSLQEAGDYSTTLTYICTPTY